MAFDYSRLTATCAVDSPENAITLPPEAYGSDELYAAEVDRIFKRGWIPLCRIEQLPSPGSYYSIDILGTPAGGDPRPQGRHPGDVAQLHPSLDGGVQRCR